MTWANNIFTGLTDGGLSAYLYWAGVKRADNSNGMLIQINTDGTLVPSGRLWAFGMFSRWIRPGAVRVGVSGVPSGLKMSAFKNPDGRLSVQILNNQSHSISVRINVSGHSYSRVKGYISDASSNGIATHKVAFRSGHAFPSVPKHSIVTVVFS